MTQSPEGRQRRGLDGVFENIRGLGIQRNTDNKWVGGVCSGVAERLGVDPIIVRGVLILLLTFAGMGLVVYLIAWAALPDRTGRILAEDGIRHGNGWGIALLVVIVIALVSDLSDRWWLWTVLLPVGLFFWWLVRSQQQGKSGPTASAEGGAAPAAAGLAAPGPTTPYAAPTLGGPTPYAAPTLGGPPTPAPHGMGPGRTGTVTAPPPRIVRRRRPRGGFLALLLTAGLAVAAYGAGAQAANAQHLTNRPELFGLGCAVGAAGFALVVIGLLGRRAGFTGFLAVLLAATAALGTATPVGFATGGAGDRVWSATSMPRDGFRLGAGDAELSLDGAQSGQRIVASVGLGSLRITVPRGMTVTTSARVGAGDVTITHVDGSTETMSGVGNDSATSRVIGSGATAVTLDAKVDLGDITIEEK